MASGALKFWDTSQPLMLQFVSAGQSWQCNSSIVLFSWCDNGGGYPSCILVIEVASTSLSGTMTNCHERSHWKIQLLWKIYNYCAHLISFGRLSIGCDMRECVPDYKFQHRFCASGLACKMLMQRPVPLFLCRLWLPSKPGWLSWNCLGSQTCCG